MDNKKITIGLATLFIIVFIAGIYAWTTLDRRMTEITDKTASDLECKIKEQKAQIDSLSAELRIKADVALFTKYDNYFITLNASISDIRDRLARIEGQLSIRKQ